MSRKPIKKKHAKKMAAAAASAHDAVKKQWNFKPFRKWVTDVSEKVLDVYALPLTRLTEQKIMSLKSKLRSSAQSI
ncbi:MAG: hypothetical protein K0R29_474 [Pseudobdellovibrio sp.]|nr:hypothetical protein [Pseudobdellovibrio sp.]